MARSPKLEKQQEARQRGEGELAVGEKNVPFASHLQAREVDGAGVLLTAGSKRRWGDNDNSRDEEFPSFGATLRSSSGGSRRRWGDNDNGSNEEFLWLK